MRIDEAPKAIADRYDSQARAQIKSIREITTDKGYFISILFKDGSRDKWKLTSKPGSRVWTREHIMR